MDDEDQVIVITMRCADMAPSSYDLEKRLCEDCGEMTWLSSSWKGKKIDKIVCTKCFYNSKEYKSGDYTANVTEECLEDAKNWARRNLHTKKTDKEIKTRMVEIMENKVGKKLKIIPKGEKLTQSADDKISQTRFKIT